MRLTHANAVGLAGVLLVWLSLPVAGSPSVSAIVQYHLAGEQFSDLYADLRSGKYDAFPQEDLLQAIFYSEGRFADFQREALIEQVLIRACEASRVSGAGATGAAEESATATLLGWFDHLGESSLRARVLAGADELSLPGMEAAVLHSAQYLSGMLQEEGGHAITQGYEVEAMALASVAPHYPSTVLAELLRVISTHSGDRRVVVATRNAAQVILRSVAGR